jgi:hypothetical protein
MVDMWRERMGEKRNLMVGGLFFFFFFFGGGGVFVVCNSLENVFRFIGLVFC